MSASKLSNVPAEKAINLRGTVYRFRELSIREYDDLVKKATSVRPNPMTGADDEFVDNTLLLRFMVLRTCVSPKLTQTMLDDLPMPVVLKLNQTVNLMHYGDEPELPIEDDDEKTEGEAGGNG
jgi:hypothetical protein